MWAVLGKRRLLPVGLSDQEGARRSASPPPARPRRCRSRGLRFGGRQQLLVGDHRRRRFRGDAAHHRRRFAGNAAHLRHLRGDAPPFRRFRGNAAHPRRRANGPRRELPAGGRALSKRRYAHRGPPPRHGGRAPTRRVHREGRLRRRLGGDVATPRLRRGGGRGRREPFRPLRPRNGPLAFGALTTPDVPAPPTWGAAGRGGLCLLRRRSR